MEWYLLPLKQDSHGMGELFPIIGKTGKFFIQSLKGNIREEMYILREIIIRLKLFLMQMKGNIFTVSDKNRRISSIGKEAPVICSIIIQSQQFRLYILHLDMDFYGTTRHRDGVKQQTIIRCGWQIVPIRLIIWFMQVKLPRMCWKYIAIWRDMPRSFQSGQPDSGRASFGMRVRRICWKLPENIKREEFR